MNAPFKIETILADAVIGISDLKRNPAAAIAEAQNQQVAILNRNKPVAYLVSPKAWERITDALEDLEDLRLLAEREREIEGAIPVTLDELLD